MIRWCSYCQSFLGEVPPFEDYSPTHAVCEACLSKGRDYIASSVNLARQMGDFYNGLREAAAAGEAISLDEIMAAGSKLGIKDIDLCVGIIQPILYEIGELWKDGHLTAAQEHLFTEFAEQVIHRFKERSFPIPNLPRAENVDVLLVCADGNYHTLGVQIIDLAMRELGLKTKAITPGLPNQDILWSVERFQPRILGISIAEQGQIEQVIEFAKTVQNDPNRVDMKILVGGSGVRIRQDLFKNYPSVMIAPNDMAALKSMLALILPVQANPMKPAI